MSVQIAQMVDGDVLEKCWKLYNRSFDDLRVLAVQRHVMYGDEFEAVMADSRVDKYLLWGEDGELQGVGTMTNQLASMPLISPDYFAHRWPDRYAKGLVFYIGFVGVDPDSHGTGVFSEIVRAMTEPVAGVEGVAVLDVCSHNKNKLHLTRAIRWLASTWAQSVEMSDLDAQTYVAYDFTLAG